MALDTEEGKRLFTKISHLAKDYLMMVRDSDVIPFTDDFIEGIEKRIAEYRQSRQQHASHEQGDMGGEDKPEKGRALGHDLGIESGLS